MLAEIGRQYLIYASAGATFTINLPPGRYTTVRFNPRTGESHTLPDLTGGPLSFTLPDTSDWVLQSTRFRVDRLP